MSQLNVNVVKVTKLHNIETNELADAYTVILFRGVEKETKVKTNIADPTWNETLTFSLPVSQPINADDMLHISVIDKKHHGMVIRQATLSMSCLVSLTDVEMNVELRDSYGRCTESIIVLNMQVVADQGNEASENFGDIKIFNADKDRNMAITSFRTGGIEKELPTKPEDFQVRITVVKARSLVGVKLNPVVRIDCCQQTRQTTVVSSSNSPYWNETFFFNLYNSGAELAREIIFFSVFDSRTLRSNALIGQFKFDIANILRKGESVINKWLLLSDFSDKTATCKGYLQVSIFVLSASDPSPKVSLKVVDEEADDIESNLLRPAGLELIPATFQLRLYRAEDFPFQTGKLMQGIASVILDSSSRVACSPCVVFKFAGNKTHSSIKYKDAQPEWNEELRLNLHWPSMCSSICLRILNGTYSKENEPIGTVFLDLAKISAEGVDVSMLDINAEGESSTASGFLPTFGPCFVNVYGAPRESSLSKDNFLVLNSGHADGVAYRGRLLVELAMNVGSMSEEASSPVSREALNRAHSFLRRRKFRLSASFINASMLRIQNSPIYFEVSIGNFGNTLDNSVPPSSSTTMPTNPVFDGVYYYFLPWMKEKPCTVVEAHWEDISYRLFAVNMLFKIIDRIESNMDKIVVARKAKLPANQQAEFVIAAFDELILLCRKNKKLPHQSKYELPETELDIRMRTLREAYLTRIADDATKIREQISSVDEGLVRLQEYRDSLKAVAYEAQNSMPDVIIWMLSGERRIAYHRVPANDVMFSDNYDYRGRYCGIEKTIFLKPLDVKTDEDPGLLPGLLRVKIWLGLHRDYHVWQKAHPEGEISVLAETYENEMNVLGRWITTGGMTRPAWSDASGRISLPKNLFQVPDGWQWEGEWYCAPEYSLYYNIDEGSVEILDDVFFHECRTSPHEPWGRSHVAFTDLEGVPATAPQQRECPAGWKWSTEWQIDFNRACDEDGWEYAVDVGIGGFIPVAKNYHMSRRRRFVRIRRMEDAELKVSADRTVLPTTADQCWEYASIFGPNVKFHAVHNKLDMVRRRRWHRKMTPFRQDAPVFFTINFDREKSSGTSQRSRSAAPRMVLITYSSHMWQLRAYMYQARDLPACSQDGFSNPYARVVFSNRSASTRRIMKSVSPMWDQTLIIENIIIHTDPNQTVENPPHVVVEVFDWEQLMEDNFVGRCAVSPMVKLDPDDTRRAVLQWFKLKRDDCPAGEMLAAFELILIDDKAPPFAPPRRGDTFTVPSGVRPFLRRTGIEILCWGVRNMKKFQMSSVNNPEVEFEVAGYSVRSDILNDASEDPNFNNPWIFLDVMLPKEELYLPPMNIRMRDHRRFGRSPVIGVHIIKDLDKFRVPPRVESFKKNFIQKIFSKTSTASFDESSSKVKEFRPVSSLRVRAQSRMYLSKVTSVELKHLDEDTDWWSKYYASTGEHHRCVAYLEQYSDRIQVYHTELEKVEGFKEFNDFLNTFKVTRGRNLEEGEDLEEVGELKGVVKIYALPDDRSTPMPTPYLRTGLPTCRTEHCIVRVYVLQAFGLQPTDHEGCTDPYVSVSIGRKEEDCRDDYVPNSLNPVFGRMFEIKCTMPMEKELVVSVKDRDLILADELIGETCIDLENRLLSRFRATVGLPESYCLSGPNVWRDSMTPLEILKDLCTKYDIQEPVIQETSQDGDDVKISIGDRKFTLEEFERWKTVCAHWGAPKQRLALHILNLMPLVKEHLELRSLYTPLQPGIEQGKLQMFIDIFPTSLGPPGPPVDVRPREPQLFYLRVVIYNTFGVKSGNKLPEMIDLYVKGWIAGIDETQKTDVHYRAIHGDGNFNWRFVFPLYYLISENVMVVKKKANFWSIDLTETKRPAELVIQIWDNDHFGPDDFVATLELPLTSMAFPVKDENKCNIQQMPQCSPDFNQHVNMFDCRRSNGFWPLYLHDDEELEMVGKVEMEIEIVNEEEAEKRPAGQGREDPNMNPELTPPKRPDTSFLWFTSPWKTFRYIIWRRHHKKIIASTFLSIVGTALSVFFYALPDSVARTVVGQGGAGGRSKGR